MSEPGDLHEFRTTLSWSGSTAGGYDGYDRTHSLAAAPARDHLTLTSDPAFRGDPDLLNPEQLLVMALSSCQMLSFLAVAARARIDVISYTDEALGVMPGDGNPMRITRIDLRPAISVLEGPPLQRLEHLVEVAHRACFIANSLTTEIVIDPSFTFSPPDEKRP